MASSRKLASWENRPNLQIQHFCHLSKVAASNFWTTPEPHFPSSTIYWKLHCLPLGQYYSPTTAYTRGHALISSASGLISKREHEGNVRRNDEAWGESIGGGHPGQQRAPFPAFLRHKTPRLREITLVAPIFESQWYCSFAAAEILFLFDEGYVDTVRLLFTKHVSWNYNIEEEILVRWSQYGRFMLGHTPVLNQLSNAIPEDRSVSARLSVVRQDMIPNSLDVMRLPQGVEVKAIFNLRRQSSMGVDF